jgi:hypothetical protein
MASRAQTNQAMQPRSSAYVTERNGRSRSLIGQITTVLLQPVYFFRTFPTTSHWIWAALIILGLIGFSAVRQSQLADNGGATPGTGAQGPISVDPGMVIPGGSGISADPGLGGVPLPTDMGGAAADEDISQPTMTALLAGGSVVLAWLAQAFVLSEVSLLNGKAPHLGRNLQLAVWAAVPLGVMAALQLLYYGAGGQGGAMGLALLLDQWTWYQAQPEFLKAVIYSLASRTTLFWLWSLLLLYLGARHALRGHAIAAFLAIAIWIVIVVLAPVLTGAITAPVPEPEQPAMSEMMPGYERVSPEGITPSETNPETENEASPGAIRVIPSGGG